MRHYLVINPEDSIGKVFNLFERFKNLSKFGTIAVCQDYREKVIGVITLGDLRRILIKKKNL